MKNYEDNSNQFECFNRPTKIPAMKHLNYDECERIKGRPLYGNYYIV